MSISEIFSNLIWAVGLVTCVAGGIFLAAWFFIHAWGMFLFAYNKILKEYGYLKRCEVIYQIKPTDTDNKKG